MHLFFFVRSCSLTSTKDKATVSITRATGMQSDTQILPVFISVLTTAHGGKVNDAF